MQEYGWFKMTLKNETQTQAAKTIFLEHLPKSWASALKTEDNTLSVFPETHIYMDDYRGLIPAICKEIAFQYPDYSFEIESHGSDDEGIYSSVETATLKEGVFCLNQVVEAVEEPDWDDVNMDDFDFDEMLDNVKVHHILIHGELVDGKMEFTETEN